MKPTVDRDLCIGCGTCEETCPEVFRLGDDGISMVINENIEPELYGPVRDAEDLCPVDAIRIDESNEGV
ncbi:MAG: ferredoxin [Coriobacteriia bacterium]|nr:ferredoxin [Coriobacteriia bacterium]